MNLLLSAAALAALALSAPVQAQDYGQRPLLERDRFSLFVAGGVQNYLGDLLPSAYNAWGARADLSPSIQIGAEYEISHSFRVRLGYYATQLKGNEASNFQNIAADELWRKQRQLSFTNDVHQVGLSAYWDVLGFLQKRWQEGERRFYITPYVGGGLAYAFLNLKMDDLTPARVYAYSPNVDEGRYYTRDFVQTTPPKSALVAPVTLGVRWQISPRSGAFLEASRHFFFTDYLDGVSNWTPQRVENDGLINYSVGYRFTLAERRY